jgi:hypothetical protein
MLIVNGFNITTNIRSSHYLVNEILYLGSNAVDTTIIASIKYKFYIGKINKGMHIIQNRACHPTADHLILWLTGKIRDIFLANLVTGKINVLTST